MKDHCDKTSTSRRVIVVIDAGIATDENLAMLTENRFDYVCVLRSKIKDHTIDADCVPVTVEDRKKPKITLQKVVNEKYNKFFSKNRQQYQTGKRSFNEQSMNNRFQESFEKGFQYDVVLFTELSSICT